MPEEHAEITPEDAKPAAAATPGNPTAVRMGWQVLDELARGKLGHSANCQMQEVRMSGGLAQRIPESAPAPAAPKVRVNIARRSFSEPHRGLRYALRQVTAAPVQPQLATGEEEMEEDEEKVEAEEAEEAEEDVVEQPRDYERPKRIDPHNTAASLMTGRSQNADATCLALYEKALASTYNTMQHYDTLYSYNISEYNFDSQLFLLGPREDGTRGHGR